ncbi:MULTISPECIES: L,D-transpeptidase family protein [Streptomyces]|uniref:Murein L,D-transpeptidase n=1 Tax=Streptomyces virginiae TaxID=1961 RepID=A0ABQ3NF02_STRVG|nr:MULTISPECIES: L,D-transpeptidase family protein [Streptomyces]KOU20625.1 hypothetical protein ADK49_10225 [Streptomyces sp. WM6349]KOU82697.1 hypothetical protein ADK94_22895 [Streptomyces sp. XY593]KOU92803.1 hypothetical protein ADK92_27385 [Streptomyces sp. XY533]KOU99609.1 hypothetical protein ADK91_27065 [Streptomyces sp. XY511]KOV45326.1 hypothetical protein ADK98_15915 [Streptomyces sp. H036]
MAARQGRGPVARAAVIGALLALAGPHPSLAAAAAAEPESACVAGTGPYQRELEHHVGRPVDGVQSAADCIAVRDFQRKNGVSPADGYAGVATYRTMLVVTARPDPNAAGECPEREHRVTCVDLERQLLWVQDDGDIVLRPVPIRTGRDFQETRTGWHDVYWRSKDHVSTLYGSPMPYAQFFDGGQALHGSPGTLYEGGGSAGCVNLTEPDAKRLWDLLGEGDAVYVWGTKPGTED